MWLLAIVIMGGATELNPPTYDLWSFAGPWYSYSYSYSAEMCRAKQDPTDQN